MPSRLALVVVLIAVSAPARARLSCPPGRFVVHGGDRLVADATGTYDVVRITVEDTRRVSVAIANACGSVRAHAHGRRLRASWSAAQCSGGGRVKLATTLDRTCELAHGTVRQARRPATRFAAARCAADGVRSDAAGEECAAADGCAGGAACVDCRCVAPVSLARDLQPVFSRSCLTVACHEGDRATGGFQLTPELAATSLRERLARAGVCAGEPLVVPGDPDASVLFRRLAGPACGGRMPLGPLPLPPEMVDAVRAWIATGAPID